MRGRGTGIYPFNRNKIPDYFFEIFDNSAANQINKNLPQDFLEDDNNYLFLFDNEEQDRDQNIPEENDNEETSSKFLHEAAPVPNIPINQSKRKQSARILVHSEVNLTTQTQDAVEINQEKNETKTDSDNNQTEVYLNIGKKGKTAATNSKKN